MGIRASEVKWQLALSGISTTSSDTAVDAHSPVNPIDGARAASQTCGLHSR